MDTEKRPPWEALHPDLTEDRLRVIGGIIKKYRDAKIFRRLPPDSEWNLGCDCYAWVCNGIRAAEKVFGEWLHVPVEDTDLDFLFHIGRVPVRFYRPDSPGQPHRTLRVAFPELKAQQIAFQFSTLLPPENVIRFAVETNAAGHVQAVTLVQLDQGGTVVYDWPVSLAAGAVIALDGATREEGVDLGEVRPSVPDEEREEEGGAKGRRGA